MSDDDRTFMRRAIALAERGWGRVHPNPLVGAVLVLDGRIIGEGYHTAFGAPHAEVEALAAAGAAARGATAYVSLEPCAHHGKTPPCTEALAAAGVTRVVFATEDPTAAGGGAAWLRDQGIDVTAGVERESARALNAGFFHAAETGTCWVALKYGLSLDGKLGRTAEETAVTGPEARADVHRLRAGFDAILVGGRTARIDDPLLTVRGEVEPVRPPLRVVLDPDARLPPAARLLQSLDEAPVLVLVGEAAPAARRRALESAGATAAAVPGGTDGLDLEAALGTLWDRGVRTVLCEGGGRVGSALVRQGLVHRIFLYYAPVLYGDEGVPAFPGPPPAGRARVREHRRLGRDVLLVVDMDVK